MLITRLFSFHAALFMGRKVRNADWHLWALHTLNPYEKHDSGFFTTPYCLLSQKLVPFIPITCLKPFVYKGKKVVPLIIFVALYFSVEAWTHRR